MHRVISGKVTTQHGEMTKVLAKIKQCVKLFINFFFIKPEKIIRAVLHTYVVLLFKKYAHIAVSCKIIKKFKNG